MVASEEKDRGFSSRLDNESGSSARHSISKEDGNDFFWFPCQFFFLIAGDAKKKQILILKISLWFMG